MASSTCYTFIPSLYFLSTVLQTNKRFVYEKSLLLQIELVYLEHPQSEFSSHSILLSQKDTLSIIQYSQHPNFYFHILLIKIIFLHNKIIYPTITIIQYITLFILSLSFFLFKNHNHHHCCITHTDTTTTTTTGNP